MIGEETVIGIEPDARPAFHRFGQQVRAELARSVAGIASLEKQPDVSPVAGAGSLQGRRQIQPTTCFQYGLRILLPLRFVQVGREEEAGFIP